MDNLLLITMPFLILLLQLIPACCSSLGHDLCNTTSSCGDISNISYPFRLTTDPIHCGEKNLEIICEDNVPMLIYNRSARYYVRSIDYNSFTIRLSDASIVPLPNDNNNTTTFLCNHSQALDPYVFRESGSYLYDYSTSYLYYGASHGGDFTDYTLVIMSCPIPLPIDRESYKWSSYVDAAICSGSVEHAQSSTTSSYWYAATSERIAADMLEDSCRVELILRTSKPPDTSKGIVSFNDVLETWSYGFDLSWLYWFCYHSSAGANQCRYPNTLTDLLIEIAGDLLVGWLRLFGYHYYYRSVADAFISYVFFLFVAFRALLSAIGAPLFLAFLVRKWRRRHISFYDNVEHFLESTYDQLMPVRYSYADINKITNNFKVKIGQGGYGCVYKGKLRSGQFAAIKILGKADSDGKDFINEVATIGRVHHFNVVRLIGFCAEGSKRALVYPFMPNGSLEKYVFPRDERDMNDIPTISDEKMHEIALGVARGIEYLHRGCEMQILHFDIKPHNILLDENFVPKVADFGLARLYPTNKSIVSLTAVKGTLGYMAPEFFYRSVGGISYKADVYSFGRMLMEMAARKKDSSSTAVNSSQIFLPSWVHDQFSQGNDIWLGDNTLEDKEIRQKMMMVGLCCVQLSPTDRPSMHKVVEMLQGRLDTLQLPPKPSFSPPLLSLNIEDSSAEIPNPIGDTRSFCTACESAENEDEAALI